MARSARPTGFRTLADQLRAWSDEELGALLGARPDLATPAPHDSTQLASRAATRSSVLRTLDQLTQVELLTLDALVVVAQTPHFGIADVLGVGPREPVVAAALDRLVALALVWVSPEGHRPLTQVAELVATSPEGCTTGVPPIAAEAPDAATTAAALDAASAPARALLDHLAANGGVGATEQARRRVALADATTPVEELLARGLLVPVDAGTVRVPGEVVLVLRARGAADAGAVPDPLPLTAPETATSDRDAALAARTAGGSAFEAVRRTELLLDHWGTHPPSALRGGGLAVRDLKAAAALLHVSETVAALLVETASAAGLLALGPTADGDSAWLPTDAYDAWAGGDLATRWVRLAAAWLTTSRTPALVGTRDAQGRAWNALAPELGSALVAEVRHDVLAALGEQAPGRSLATGTGPASLVARLRWLRPRRPAVRDAMVAWTLDEGAELGVLGLGQLTAAGRALLADDLDGAAAAVADLLPRPVDHVLLQADLTAVAPGPLTSDVARALQLLADVESAGGATVYRFTAPSVRRALDAGWSAAEVHAYVAEVSRTPVPQPLTYLVDDVARTYGTLRVGQAEAFLRADDEAALAELLHHPRAGQLGLRRIAPTVLVSTTPIDVLLPRLRELGAAPVLEAPDGTVRVARPDLQRARTPRAARGGGAAGSGDRAAARARRSAQVSAALTALRAGDRIAETRPPTPDRTRTPAEALAALREAAEAGRQVLIGFLDSAGMSSERLVEPRSVEGGQLVAYDHRTDDTRSFAVHRISSVRAVPDGS